MNMEKIIRLVTKTKELIKNREMAAHVKEKGVADYVTQVDIAVQNFLKKELFLLAPDIQFLGEETGLQEMKADSFWILDPVDGTTNLMHDYQHSVVSLALCYQDEIVMGIVYNPFHEEIFSAIKGKGSFLNGQPIKVSKAEKLSDTIIGLGTAKRELADENFARFRRVFGACQDVRRIGSAALELAYTACGRQDGYFEIYLNPWDYAAGMLLVQEAGGIVTDFAGNPHPGGGLLCRTVGQSGPDRSPAAGLLSVLPHGRSPAGPILPSAGARRYAAPNPTFAYDPLQGRSAGDRRRPPAASAGAGRGFFTDLPQGNVSGSGRSDAAGYGHPSNSGPRRRLFRPPGRNPSGNRPGRERHASVGRFLPSRRRMGRDRRPALCNTRRHRPAPGRPGQPPGNRPLPKTWIYRGGDGSMLVGNLKMDKICGHAVPGRRARILYPFVTKLSQDGDGRTDDFAVW